MHSETLHFQIRNMGFTLILCAMLIGLTYVAVDILIEQRDNKRYTVPLSENEKSDAKESGQFGSEDDQSDLFASEMEEAFINLFQTQCKL